MKSITNKLNVCILIASVLINFFLVYQLFVLSERQYLTPFDLFSIKHPHEAHKFISVSPTSYAALSEQSRLQALVLKGVLMELASEFSSDSRLTERILQFVIHSETMNEETEKCIKQELNQLPSDHHVYSVVYDDAQRKIYGEIVLDKHGNLLKEFCDLSPENSLRRGILVW